MYLVSIIVGNAMVGLMYQSEDSANAAVNNAEQYLTQTFERQTIVLKDDFGQTARICGKDWHGCIVEDLNLSKMARAEQMVHQARCQGVAQKLAQADVTLRTMHGSPAVITPNMGGPNGFGPR